MILFLLLERGISPQGFNWVSSSVCSHFWFWFERSENASEASSKRASAARRRAKREGERSEPREFPAPASGPYSGNSRLGGISPEGYNKGRWLELETPWARFARFLASLAFWLRSLFLGSLRSPSRCARTRTTSADRQTGRQAPN